MGHLIGTWNITGLLDQLHQKSVKRPIRSSTNMLGNAEIKLNECVETQIFNENMCILYFERLYQHKYAHANENIITKKTNS